MNLKAGFLFVMCAALISLPAAYAQEGTTTSDSGTSTSSSGATTSEFGVLLGIGLDMVSASSNTGVSIATSSNVGFVGGLAYDWWFMPGFGFEIDAMYTHRSDTITLTSTNESRNDIDVPLMVRWLPIPFLSVGLGPYIGFGVGSITTTTVAGVTTSVPYSGTEKSLDFGGVLSAQGRFPIMPNINALLDIRYLLGLTNLNDVAAAPNGSIKARDLEFLAGLSFSM